MRYADCKMSIWKADAYMIKPDAMGEGYCRPRGVALDIGAHVGTRAVWLATDGGFHKVFAVEMEPDNFSLLCKNIEQNNLWHKIIPIQAAISDRARIQRIAAGGINRGQFSIAYDVDGFKEVSGAIMTTPLQWLIKSIGHIDFMKMDIEGEEYPIFAHFVCRAMIRNHVRYMFLERHGPNLTYFSDDFFKRFGYDPESPNRALFDNLHDCGFEDIKENNIGQLMMYNARFYREEFKHAVGQ